MNQIEFYKAKLSYETDSWDLYESLERGDDVVVIDARSSEAFELEHIPSAVNFPHREMNPESVSKLNQSSVYISYCDGIGCNASTKGALKLAEFGFKVKELLGGLDWWRRDGYTTKGKNGQSRKQSVCGC